MYKYLAIGCLGLLIEYTVFLCLCSVGVSYVLANIVAFNSAFVTCFILQRKYTFDLGNFKEGRRKHLLKYIVLMYAQLLIGTVILEWLLYHNKLEDYIAKLIQMVLIIPASYIAQKKWVFK